MLETDRCRNGITAFWRTGTVCWKSAGPEVARPDLSGEITILPDDLKIFGERLTQFYDFGARRKSSNGDVDGCYFSG